MTGLVLPAKEICQLARKHGVLTHVDGAHAIGQIPLNLHDLGCDFYATSPHKWLLAPKGTGTALRPRGAARTPVGHTPPRPIGGTTS